MISSAIFDFDGTLFDSMSVWDTVAADYLSSIGMEAEANLSEKLVAMSLLQAACYIKREYRINASEEEIVAGFNRMAARAYRSSIMPKPGVPAFLEEMAARGIKMSIATAADKKLVAAALERCGLSSFFCGIATCDAAGVGKGEPFVFRAALKLLKSSRTRSLVFEDSLHALETASADGFITVAVAEKSEPRLAEVKALADFFLEDYRDLDAFWAFLSSI